MSGETSPPGSDGETVAALPPWGGRDPGEACERITAFVADYVHAADADGVVVNLSGGLDSTVTATLAVEALDPESVFGLVMPGSKIAGASAQDAEAVADLLGIEHETLQVQPLLAQLGDVAPDRVDLPGNPVVRGNFVSRLRMALAYLAANDTDRLVVGTTNRSELLLGYFTKYGDGGADFLPLGAHYKTEVEAMAWDLGVPEFVLEKQPTAGFWPGQTDAADLGESYEVIDAVLALRAEAGLAAEAIQTELDVDREGVERILHHYETTSHKRAVPPTPAAD